MVNQQSCVRTICLLLYILQAGILQGQLKFALEPEAASLYCRVLPLEKLDSSDNISPFKSGAEYMVLDLGGKNYHHNHYNATHTKFSITLELQLLKLSMALKRLATSLDNGV